MSLIAFNNLPDVARLWVFNSDRDISGELVEQLGAEIGRFLERWTAHRVDVPSGFEIRDGRFILIGADTRQTGTAGCSIDSMIGFLRELQQQFDLTIIDAPEVCYRSADGVNCVSRSRFEELANSGEVNAGTIVFDNTVTSVSDLREERWEKPARQSWHARAFNLKEEGAKVE